MGLKVKKELDKRRNELYQVDNISKRQEKRNRTFRKTTKKERAQPWRADWGCDQMAPAGAKKARSNTKNTPKEKIFSKNRNHRTRSLFYQCGDWRTGVENASGW